MKKRAISIYHTAFESPIGIMHIGMTEKGICCIAWSSSSWNKYIETINERYMIDLSSDESRSNGIRLDFGRYFAGGLNHFSAPVDLLALTPFQQRVLKTVRTIRYGSVKSYHDIAVEAGSPNASRAVGNALGKNPVPIVVPCHRVVKSDGTLGGFTGGTSIKRYLLQLEKAA